MANAPMPEAGSAARRVADPPNALITLAGVAVIVVAFAFVWAFAMLALIGIAGPNGGPNAAPSATSTSGDEVALKLGMLAVIAALIWGALISAAVALLVRGVRGRWPSERALLAPPLAAVGLVLVGIAVVLVPGA